MRNPSIVFQDCKTATTAWQQLHFSIRQEKVMVMRRTLETMVSPSGLTDVDVHRMLSVIDYHVSCSERFLASTISLPGPTGETNELYCTGRGVSLLMVNIEKNSDNALSMYQAFFAQLTNALLSGNGIIMVSDDHYIETIVAHLMKDSLFPKGLMSCVALDDIDDILHCDIRLAGLVGCESHAVCLNKKLAQKQGVIVPFYWLGIDDELALFDPAMCLHFICEKTRSINITAVGGNTQLLAQGVSDGA